MRIKSSGRLDAHPDRRWQHRNSMDFSFFVMESSSEEELLMLACVAAAAMAAEDLNSDSDVRAETTKRRKLSRAARTIKDKKAKEAEKEIKELFASHGYTDGEFIREFVSQRGREAPLWKDIYRVNDQVFDRLEQVSFERITLLFVPLMIAMQALRSHPLWRQDEGRRRRGPRARMSPEKALRCFLLRLCTVCQQWRSTLTCCRAANRLPTVRLIARMHNVPTSTCVRTWRKARSFLF
jgi:hypothetical protein